jgi:hypothetical protein
MERHSGCFQKIKGAWIPYASITIEPEREDVDYPAVLVRKVRGVLRDGPRTTLEIVDALIAAHGKRNPVLGYWNESYRQWPAYSAWAQDRGYTAVNVVDVCKKLHVAGKVSVIYLEVEVKPLDGTPKRHLRVPAWSLT